MEPCQLCFYATELRNERVTVEGIVVAELGDSRVAVLVSAKAVPTSDGPGFLVATAGGAVPGRIVAVEIDNLLATRVPPPNCILCPKPAQVPENKTGLVEWPSKLSNVD